ncbi:hypothetical protein [Streptomyces broussonetiae]|uniref:Uncharacterized protein n=1 Tax=Streptomyces broussonetiae TaxID=2686304 RepID=A0ABV5EDV1_9ACTN
MRPPVAFRCEAAAYDLSGSREVLLATYRGRSPRLAARWLRGSAHRFARLLSPDIGALGLFRLSSPSWDLAESVPTLRKALSETDWDALCELVAETVEFTTRDGAAPSYCRPSIKVIGPWHNPDQHAA